MINTPKPPYRPGLIIAAAAAFLLPLSAFADEQLSLSHTQSGNAVDSATITGPSFNYSNNQTAPPGTSLSDSAGNSEGAYSSVASAVQVFYGSAHMTGAAAALESAPDGTLGAAGANAGVSWTSQLTINSPGRDGQAATVRLTFHGSGDASGAASSYYAGSSVTYGYSVSDPSQNGAGYSGSWNTTDGWTGDGPPNRTFSFDANCTFGQPCEITHSASFSISASTGEPDFGDPQSCNTQVSGSLSFRDGSVQVLDPNDSNASVSFTVLSNIGSGRGEVVPAGGMYGGFSLTNDTPGRLGSTIQLLDGTASATTQVVAAFVAPPDASENVKLVSDAVDLTGTNSDPVVVQVSIDQHGLAGAFQYLQLGWEKSAGVWTNAVLGNSGTTMPTHVTGAYNPATDFHLGYYGFDLVNKVAWAVVNHNSRFGVMPSPLAIRSLSRPAANTIHLNCKGEPGAVNRLEASTTLAANSFTTIASITADDAGSFQFDDTNAGTRRFYRVAFP